MTRSPVLVAMSGGVDSSLAAALVKARGDTPVGVTMSLMAKDQEAPADSRQCCSARDNEDAASVARRLDFNHYVLDLSELFEGTVMRPFAQSYLKGETPLPCAECNVFLKFDALFQRARQVGARKVVTGHYARIDFDQGRYRLLESLDPAKDQTYFLFAMTQRELSQVEFPLGEMSKPEVRQQARDLGLATADKPESQDICFVKKGRYGEVVRRYAGERPLGGDIKDQKGNILGQHEGYVDFTVGQRRGIGIGAKNPLYVIRIDPKSRSVVVGEDGDLLASSCTLRKVSFTHPCLAVDGVLVDVCTRYRGQRVPARLWRKPQGGWRVDFQEPMKAVAPGQAAVFYRGQEMLGGGTICEVEPHA